MRYLLVDRFLELETGRRALAVKCVTLGEPFLADLDAYPAALVLEAILQTGGMLSRASTGFTRQSVLGKIESAAFPGEALPGDRILLEVEVILSRAEGTLCEGTATVDGRLIGRARFLIVFVPPEMAPEDTPAIKAQRIRHMRAINIPLGGA